MTEPIVEFPIRRYRQGQFNEIKDRITVEEPLEIRLAGEPFQVLMRLPGWEKELVVGFLFSEGIIRNLSEITTIHFCDTVTNPLLPPNVVDVILTPAAQACIGRQHLQRAYSSCSLYAAKEAIAEIRQDMPPVSSNLTIDCPTLLALMGRLAAAQTVFQETGGTHGVALASPNGQDFLIAEDIGRHNALDKVIGQALFQRQDMTRMVALLSGRISFEIALKTARANIPILAAISAPTSMALTLAHELNITLAGFARGQSMNAYTHPERIVEEKIHHRGTKIQKHKDTQRK